MVSQERSDRRTQLSQRLNSVLAQINDATRRRWRPSHVAQAIGASLAEPAEDWFLGRTEPTFEELAKVADFLGVSARWLQHGDGEPFLVGNVRLSEDPAQAVRWLLNRPDDPLAPLGPFQPASSFPELQRLIFVRSSSEAGELAIIKQRDDYRCETFRTPTHVSDVIGAGGEAQLMALSVTLQLLYKLYSRPPSLPVTSWILPEKSFSALIAGRVHPLSFDDGSSVRLWWEDFWDESMTGRNSYWTGWSEITARIRRAIDLTDRVAKERELIRTGEHPALTVRSPAAARDVSHT
ncbi:helix-turn-helix transcriptional regulator [Achromobacter kerstersii]|uniref:helix-turn-helix domain-containing protein n=1 Tax=Achromobacter kerstersii TaxID=1353890 RepID=UPI00313DB785